MKVLISVICILFSVQSFSAPVNTIKNNNEAAAQLHEVLKSKQQQLSVWGEIKAFYSESLNSVMSLFGMGAAASDASGLKGRVASQLSEKEQKEKQNMEMEVKALSAQAKLVEALSSDSFSLESFMNLGLSFELLAENDKAIKSYTQALNGAKNKDPKIEFYAYYNLGRMYGKIKNTDKALEMYQQALRFAPDSKEIKTNIELLIQKNQGKGKGKGKSKSDQKDKSKKDDKDKNKNKDKDQKQQPQKPKKQEFKSKNLKKKDMQKIMEEIRKQEQRIRAKEFGKQRKEPPRDKDW